MSTSTPGATRAQATDGDGLRNHRGPVRRSTETKAAFKTTEFFVYVAIVIATLIAAAVIDESDAGGFGARQAWLYVTILTVGYMVSRGLAKSGSRDPYTADDDR
jgi:fucose permease